MGFLLPKPARGSEVLRREREAANALALELLEKKAVRQRDGRCRWPEKHKCRGVLEAAHIRDASLGGAMESGNLVLLCSWIHRRGPESIHGKQLKIQPETTAGAWGPLSFWRQDEGGIYYMVRREIGIGVFERD